MESFFRRMSSIVKNKSNKSTDVDQDDETNNEQQQQQQQQFRRIQQRRRSAPDIHRRSANHERKSNDVDYDETIGEQIRSRMINNATSTAVSPQMHHNAEGKQCSM
jgi:hypothetical protein